MRLIPPIMAESTRSDGERAVFEALAASERAGKGWPAGRPAARRRPRHHLLDGPPLLRHRRAPPAAGGRDRLPLPGTEAMPARSAPHSSATTTVAVLRSPVGTLAHVTVRLRASTRRGRPGRPRWTTPWRHSRRRRRERALRRPDRRAASPGMARLPRRRGGSGGLAQYGRAPRLRPSPGDSPAFLDRWSLAGSLAARRSARA